MKKSAILVGGMLVAALFVPVAPTLAAGPNFASSPSIMTLKKIKGNVFLGGSSFVGGKVRVAKVTTSPKASTYSVQWLREGVAISGAKGKSYKLTNYDAGYRISARIRIKQPGYRTTQIISSARKVQSRLENQISSRWPGFPKVVNTSSVDEIVSSWFENTPRLVALAPSLYTPYNPNVANLSLYVETAPVSGDCIMKQMLFPNRSGVCWDGITDGGSSNTNTPKPSAPTPSEIALWQSIINLNNQLIQLNEGIIARNRSDLSVKEYQLTVAVRYGDSLRAGILEADIAEINSYITSLEAENTSLRAENADLEAKIRG